MPEKPDGSKKRIAIIGGGPASLVAAFHLTQCEPDAYDITIYEMSWRLGGKTASGRAEHGRIEEHGLHVLFGCYHNVFRTMLRCYEELRNNRLAHPAQHRFAYFYDAISPHHVGVIGDDRSEPWRPLFIQFPSNRGVPGDAPLPSTWDLCSMLFQIAWLATIGSDSLRALQRALPHLFDYRNRWKRNDVRTRAWEPAHPVAPNDELGGDLISRLMLKLAKHAFDAQTSLGALNAWTLPRLQRAWRVLGRVAGRARFWSAGDFMIALFRGLLADGVLREAGGFERIDRFDLRQWLGHHGATPQTLGSPWMRVIYDAAFSYVRGGAGQRGQASEEVAAGAAVRALLLMVFTYKGCFYNKMEAGMGDVIHTPLYLVLTHRGVKFEFFHRLVDIKPDAEGRRVDTLEFDTLLTHHTYRPLVEHEGLLCWPSQPKLEELDPLSRARAAQAEHYHCSAPRSLRVLSHGRDFDHVLLGIPVACLPYACPSLVARSRALRDQRHIDTVQTIAAQLWMQPTLSELGWTHDSPLLSLFYDPLNTWCDMSHLLPREGWPAERPGSLAYFCGPMPHDHVYPAPDALATAPDVQRKVQAQAQVFLQQLLERLHELWPAARAGEAFDYAQLFDRLDRRGRARLEAQYLRVNFEPHHLCTLALPNHTQFRLRADQTGFDNLLVTGDWTDNGVYLACVEGAFQAGIRSARALSRRCAGDYRVYRIVAEGLLNLRARSSKAPPLE